MSYHKKISNFLVEAKSQNIIDEMVFGRLDKFAKEQNGQASVGKLMGTISFLGGFSVLLGLILLISHNWQQIGDASKISFYLVSLVGVHFVGFLLYEKYPRISSVVHFIGAGYVLAGIGLMAQIFHLSSLDGRVFLLWSVMILPLALILRNKLIGVLAVAAFYMWLSIDTHQSMFVYGLKGVLIYYTAMSVNLILIPRVLNFFEDSFDHVKIVGLIILLSIIMILGFSHDIGSNELMGILGNKGKSFYHLSTKLMMVANIGMLAFLLAKRWLTDSFSDKAFMVLLVLALVLPFFIGKNYLIIISAFYWALWFAFSWIMIAKGIDQSSRATINFGTWMFVIGILARFMDLVGTMLFTGSMFMVFGLVLIVAAVLGEKYRKFLIKKISK